MTYPMRRPLVLLRASRETVVLLACATGFTLALAHAAHHRGAVAPAATETVRQGWTGDLAGPAPAAPHAPEPLTSASLIVPAAALAAPIAPPAAPVGAVAAGAAVARQPAPAKARPCDQPACAPAKPGPQLAAAPVAHQGAAVEPVRLVPQESPGLIGRLNPLQHLPDAVRRPFDYAGDAVTSWIRRL